MKKKVYQIPIIFVFVLFANVSFGSDYYTSVKVLSELSNSEQEEYLKSVNDDMVGSTDKAIAPWKHSEEQVGFIPERDNKTVVTDILPAHDITSDINLKKINIRLDRLRVYDYPGFGKDKNIQLTFEAANDVKIKEAEQVAFTQAYGVREGQGAGVTGYPIFIGLNVPITGVNLRVVTINLKTDEQVSALGILDSSTFKSGLSLLETAQPAIAPFTTIAIGAAKMATESGDGKEIQKFQLGLDFDNGSPSGVRLKIGTYIVVQAPYEEFKWSEYEFNYEIGRITKKKMPDTDIPFNYILFRISKI